MVYFIVENVARGFMKIGYTADNSPSSRLESMQTANPRQLIALLCVAGGREVEQAFHEQFAKLHVRGEWFEYRGALRRFVERSRPNLGSVYVSKPSGRARDCPISAWPTPERPSETSDE